MMAPLASVTEYFLSRGLLRSVFRTTDPGLNVTGRDHAKRLLDDDTLLLRWERTYQQMRAEDADLKHASQTDEELSRVAAQMLRSTESPPVRLDVIIELLRSFRQISQERVNWCRHLQILEDLTVNRDPKLPIAYCQHARAFATSSTIRAKMLPRTLLP